MSKHEAKRVIERLIDNARADYGIRQLNRELNAPGFIQSKGLALKVCHALIQICVEDGGVAEGSFMHRLGLQLMDYVTRSGEPAE